MNKPTEILNNFNEIDKYFPSNSITLIHMNIRSLRKNFIPLIAQIKHIMQKTHLLILTETNISDDESRFYGIEGFSATFINRQGRGGGIAVYVNENINYNCIPLNTNSCEAVKIEVTINQKTVTIIPVYRPPNQNINMFLSELEQEISTNSKTQNLVVVGDMNINIQKPNVSTTTRYLNMLSSYGLQCMVAETTRENTNNNTSSCIDHLFIRCKQSKSQAQAAIITTTISDHYTIIGCIGEEQKRNNVNSNVCQGAGNAEINEKINNASVNMLIRTTDWNEVINQSNNTDELFDRTCRIFHHIYEKSAAQTKRNRKRNPYPWLSEYLVKCCNIRDKLYKKLAKNRSNDALQVAYKKFNNVLNKKLIKAKNDYNMQQFIINRNNVRETWQLVNTIIGKRKTNIDETVKKNFPNMDLKEMPDLFAIKFKENVDNIIHICSISTIPKIPPNMPNTMYMEHTDEREILNILKNLNVRKSAGVDGIRGIDLKNNAYYLTPAITKLVNGSLNEHVIPNLLKTSLVRPIYKGGVKTDFNNYRPIAILPVIEKVIEEIVARRLNDFMVKYKIIHENQYGFQKGKNINQLVGHFSNNLNLNLSNDMHSLVLFIDFSKAFDTLPHDKLLDTLEKNGVRGPCIEWFKNYLQCRCMKVKIANNISDEIPTPYGVPQGSKLGPLLYIIYANDMIKMLKYSTAYAYADDTAIVVSHASINRASEIMQKELNILTKWCHDSGLIINASKTKIMHIRPRRFPRSSNEIIFHGTNCLHTNQTEHDSPTDTCSTRIEYVQSYKYLGIYVDEYLKWNVHTEILQKKLRKSSYALYHLSNCAPPNVLRQAYFSLVESYIRHGITAWGTGSSCRLLQETQNRIVKILLKNQKRTNMFTSNQISRTDSNIHTTDLHTQHNVQNIPNFQQTITNNHNIYKTMNILNVKNLFELTIVNEFYNNKKYLQCINHQQNTRRRREGRYKIPKFRNNYGKNSLAVTLPKTLNEMPTNLLNIIDNKYRKKVIKEYFLNK